MNMRRILILFALLSSMTFLLSCRVTKSENSLSSTAVAENAAVKPAPGGWESEWEKTLAQGRKEGKVVLYTTTSPATRDAIIEGFSKRTGISPDIITGRGGEIVTRLLAERRSGLYLADAYVGGTTSILTSIKPAGALAPIKPVLFLPEVLDTSLWYKNTLPWVDKDQLILQTRMMPGGSQGDIAFMSGAINRQEFLSWQDLLRPHLKGKMSLQDPMTAGKGGKWINKGITYFGLDWDYFKALAKQEPFITRDERLQIEWVVRGRHLLAINPDTDTGDEFRAAGSPLEYTIFRETKDILGGGSSGVALLDKAPHQNAARLFINWFLSKEGQTYFARSYRVQSARMDTPVDHLTPNKIRQAGVDYPVETEEFVLQEDKYRPKIIEIFGPLAK